MLDKDCIQSRGFTNVVIDGEVTGFQLNIRSLYYRGIWVSQLRPATVVVDGTSYSGDQVTWTIAGATYSQDELGEQGDKHWGLLEPATLTITCPGGLAQGVHDIEVVYTWSASYMPPSLDTFFGSLFENKRRLVLV